MKKHWLTAALLTCFCGTVFSQTLFTYGPHKVTSAEFLRAFNKNNQQPTTDRQKALSEYLDLYINSRLRIQEAYARRYDTLPQVKDEVANLRNQIIDNYMSDPDAVTRLTAEAFQRSQKDIHAAHIFIAFTPDGSTDTVAARKKLNLVNQRLAKGEDFMSVARELSDDPSARENGGDLNYITAFTLPYEFESILYKTAPGKHSRPFVSNAGYHIFKNLGERKAIGKMSLQQILLAFPPGATEADKAAIGQTTDSLYQVLQKGGDFAKLASAFSNDNLSAHSDGRMTDVSVGQFDPAFESAVWSIQTDGTIARPFRTRYGYHIVKRISAKPIVTDAADKENNELLQQKVMNDDRWKTAKDFIYARVKEKAGYKTLYNEKLLWAISDSLLDNKPAGAGRALTPSSPVFKVGDSTIHVAEWITYSHANRYKVDRSSLKDYPTLMDEMSRQVMYQYYRDHLEDFNPEFKYQMGEFRDGNMFFEVMQQEVWNKSQGDSVALLRLYNTDKSKYLWKESATAIIFFCTDSATAADLSAKVKASPASWKKLVEAVNEKVVADSSRFEYDQIPGLKGQPVANSLGSVVVNPTDNTATFAYIKEVFAQPSQRSFADAKGLVMNDYQVILENKWTAELRSKYPVKIDQKELAKISKEK